MARRIRFPLKMKNGAEVRTLDELKANFDLESVLSYYDNGKLQTWLENYFYDEQAKAIAALSPDMPDLNQRLCEILGVEYQDANSEMDMELIQRRNEKLRILNSETDDRTLIDNVDIVALDQDDLYDILDTSDSTQIYLYKERFFIPFGKKNIHYIGVNEPEVDLEKSVEEYRQSGITFSGIGFPNDIEMGQKPELLSIVTIEEAEKLFLSERQKEAFPSIKAAAEQGNPRAMLMMAFYYNGGYNTVEVDKKERDRWLSNAAKTDNLLLSAWKLYFGGLTKNNLDQWLRIIDKITVFAEETDDPFAQLFLALNYEKKNYGYDRQDYSSANRNYFSLFVRAAELGLADAQFHLGFAILHFEKRILSYLYNTARDLIQMSANQGYKKAVEFLSNHYLECNIRTEEIRDTPSLAIFKMNY